MKKVFYIVLVFYSISITAQTIDDFSIDSGGASVSTSDIQLLYTIGEVNVQERIEANVQVSEGFINSVFEILVDPKIFLQGPMINPQTTGLMNDDLRSGNYLPTTSPYADNATVDTSVFSTTGNNAIVDWVWVELRAANDNTLIVNARSALLQRDGDIVDIDGVSNFNMQAPPNNYFIVIKHRNHLGVMSSNAFALSENAATVLDFRDTTFSTFGNNAQVLLPSNAMALWTGNTNADTLIQYTGSVTDTPNILAFVLNDSSNFLNLPTFVIDGYTVNDIDLNGITQYTGSMPDTPLILQNVLSHPSNSLNLSTFQILEQLPEN